MILRPRRLPVLLLLLVAGVMGCRIRRSLPFEPLATAGYRAPVVPTGSGLKGRMSIRLPRAASARKLRAMFRIEPPDRFQVVWLDPLLNPLFSLISDGERLAAVDLGAGRGLLTNLPPEGARIPPLDLAPVDLVRLMLDIDPPGVAEIGSNGAGEFHACYGGGEEVVTRRIDGTLVERRYGNDRVVVKCEETVLVGGRLLPSQLSVATGGLNIETAVQAQETYLIDEPIAIRFSQRVSLDAVNWRDLVRRLQEALGGS
ncbi:hypothetical protein JW905_04830 [bacterium]|nr:hypothetical protein [candidate division CSSED10-310 bacterium]